MNETCVVDVDECVEIEPCLHDGTCTNTIGDYECSCPSGYQGKDCEIRVSRCYHKHMKNLVAPKIAVIILKFECAVEQGI